MKYVIKQLSPESWQAFKEFRLEAIKTDPQAFGMSYEQEIEQSPVDWKDFIQHMFFATIDDKIVGMVGFMKNGSGHSKHTAQVISFWVKPEYRGQGIGRALVQYIQKCAQAKGFKKLFLYVTASQGTAIALYSALGFEKVGTLKKHVHSEGDYLDQYVMEWHI